MSPAKPIDWTRPLRTTGVHHYGAEVWVERISPRSSTPISIHLPETGARFEVTRDGCLHGSDVPFVENVPEEEQ